MMDKGRGLNHREPGAQLPPNLALRAYGSASQCLSFALCKMGLNTVTTPLGCQVAKSLCQALAEVGTCISIK